MAKPPFPKGRRSVYVPRMLSLSRRGPFFGLLLASTTVTAAACTAILGIDKDYQDVSGGVGGSTSHSVSSTGPTTSTGGQGGATTTTTTTSTGGGGSAQGGGGSGGSGPECTKASDCKQPDPKDICNQALCTMGKCSIGPIAMGTATAMQTAGDCKKLVCDGNGAAVNQADDSDKPNDMMDCTADDCSMGSPAFTPQKAGFACSMGGKVCDGAGNCVACVVTADCVAPNICQNFSCVSPTCNDNMKDGQETDKDCGGPACGPCADGLKCNGNGDCIDKICNAGTCSMPTCMDNVQNGKETDKDCGGGVCKLCLPHQGCIVNSDCQGNSCNGQTCNETCTDLLKDNNETDIDCGGPSCPKCNFMQTCQFSSDCLSGFCNANNKCACPPHMSPLGNQCGCDVGFIDCNNQYLDGCETAASIGPELHIQRTINPSPWPAFGHSFAPLIAFDSPATGTYGITWIEVSGGNGDQWFATIDKNGAGQPTLAKVNANLSDVVQGTIAWDGSNFNVAYTRSSGLWNAVINTGGGIITNANINNDTGAFSPAIGVNAMGGYLAAFSTTTNAGNPPTYHTKVQFGPVPPAGNLLQTNQSQLVTPTITFNGSVFGLAFIDNNNNISFNIFDKNGLAGGAIGVGFNGNPKEIHSAWFGSTFGVIWISGNQLWFAGFDVNGMMKVPPTTLTAPGIAVAGSIAGGDGGFRIVYENGGTNQLDFMRIKEDGTKTGINYQFTNGPAGTREQPSIDYNGLDFGVVFIDTRNNTRDLYFSHLPSCPP